MNEPAQRCEEQIISLFLGMETLICHGWILKKMERQLLVYPLCYKFSEGNIPDNIWRCEEISRQSGKHCVFRIVEHTNYHLSGVLTDSGYTLWKCGVVCELCLTGSESCLSGEKKGQDGRLFLRKRADEEIMEYVMSEADTVIGIKRQELLFLPDGNLPEQYKRAGFDRAYLYCCYQKQEDIGNGFTE